MRSWPWSSSSTGMPVIRVVPWLARLAAAPWTKGMALLLRTGTAVSGQVGRPARDPGAGPAPQSGACGGRAGDGAGVPALGTGQVAVGGEGMVDVRRVPVARLRDLRLDPGDRRGVARGARPFEAGQQA